MTSNDENVAIKGKYTAMFLCWVLGTRSLSAWSLLTTLDYYIAIFPDYHPSRVLIIAVLSFAFGIITILTYYEAEMNNRLCKLIGFTIYVIGSILVLALNLAISGNGSIGAYIGMCAICVSFGVAEGFVQGAMGGDLSFINQEFIQSFSAGVVASGTLAFVLRLAINAAFENTEGGLGKGAWLTNGYLAVCALMAAPKGYKGPKQNALGNMMQTCLIGGVLAGLTFGWLWLIGKGW